MTDLFELLAYDFNQRALLASAVIGLVSGYLSGYVVLRKSALFTGALANTLFPGITLGFMLFGVSAVSAFVGGLSMALCIGLLALTGMFSQAELVSAMPTWRLTIACKFLG